jgi:hypothetical protein
MHGVMQASPLAARTVRTNVRRTRYRCSTLFHPALFFSSRTFGTASRKTHPAVDPRGISRDSRVNVQQ